MSVANGLASGGLTKNVVHRLRPLNGTPHAAAEVRALVRLCAVESELSLQRSGVLDQFFARRAPQPSRVLRDPELRRNLVALKLAFGVVRASAGGGDLLGLPLLLGLVTVLVLLVTVSQLVTFEPESFGLGAKLADLRIYLIVRLLVVVLLASAAEGLVVYVVRLLWICHVLKG